MNYLNRQITILLFLFPSCLFGFYNVSIVPSNPTNHDTVFLIYTYTTPKYPAPVYSSQVFFMDTIIELFVCSGYGQQDGGVTYQDTINLGVLLAGNYTCKLNWHRTSLTDTFCTGGYIENTYQIGFTVGLFNNMNQLTTTNQFGSICFPQPSSDYNILQIESESFLYVQIELYDLIGKRISTVYSGNLNKGVKTITTDVSNMSSGVYFYKIKSKDYDTSIKFIKQ